MSRPSLPSLPRRLAVVLQPAPLRHLLAYLVASFAAFAWLRTFGWGAAAAAAAMATLVHGLTMPEIRPLRGGAIPRIARVADVLVHLFWLYCVVAFGSMLSWAVPSWIPAVLALMVAVWVFDRLRGPRIRLPIGLPMGLWIAACLLGWRNEDGRVRCDDYLALQQDDRVRVIVPTHSALEQCRPDNLLRVHRYPRAVWEYPDGQNLLFTTQPGLKPPRDRTPGATVELDGSVCRTSLGRRLPVRCIGTGKAQGIAESERHDRVYVAEWMSNHGEKSGTVFALPRTGPLTVLDKLELDRKSGALFYDPHEDLLGVFFDDMDGMLPVRAADLAPGPVVDAPFLPGDILFDPVGREGMLCYAPSLIFPFEGRAAAAIAFRLGPFASRRLLSSEHYPWTWGALVWGCAFDPIARDAWILMANTGLLLAIDFDTGRLRDAYWVGFGARKTVHDPVRRRLYIADFLRGDVIVWDLDRNREIARHFAGRFLRGLSLSRDGRTLWMASTLGILALDLDGRDDRALPTD